MKRFHSEQKEDFGKLLKRFKSETWNKKDCLRKHSKKDLRKHTKSIFIARRMICGTCNIKVLKSKGTELGKSSEGSTSDALDPALKLNSRIKIMI